MNRPLEVAPVPLCRYDGHTCGACCWGDDVTRRHLESQLRRQTRLARFWTRLDRLPGRLQLLLYEVGVRRGLDLWLSLLLLVPGLGDWLRPRLKRRMICAFLGFEDDGQERIGCFLHPTRWKMEEVRPKIAFGLLRGFSCGSPDYLCLAAHWFFSGASWEERKKFSDKAASMDWYAFSREASWYVPPKPRRLRKETTKT